MTFKIGKHCVDNVNLPMKLMPSEYTFILTLCSEPPLTSKATVNVGAGLFVTELVMPHAGLLIQKAHDKTVYDNKPEGTACPADLRPALVAADGVPMEPWGVGFSAVKSFEVKK